MENTNTNANSSENNKAILENYLDNEQNPRIPDEEVSLTNAYGSVAYWLGKKADEYHSHEWTVVGRGQKHIAEGEEVEAGT